MDVGIFFNPNTGIGGPHKVAKNLSLGLAELGVDFGINTLGDKNGVLQCDAPYYKSDYLPKTTLMGPNLVVTPDNDGSLWTMYSNFVVPSKWVYDLYRTYGITRDCKIDIWSVGIDTDKFNSDKEPGTDCLIYFKNRESDELEALKNLLTLMGLTYTVISYGTYNEEYFIQTLRSVRFAVLLTGTESQGIAYMEILSTNTPCFVWDKTDWNGHKATSVPYFSSKCGVISETLNTSKFETFINNMHMYTPREYILSNHTLKASAYKYYNLLIK